MKRFLLCALLLCGGCQTLGPALIEFGVAIALDVAIDGGHRCDKPEPTKRNRTMRRHR